MSESAPLRLNGCDLLADLSGALIWPHQRLLAVADLHLEKGSGYATRGQFLPPYDTAATLQRLAATIARHAPDTVVCLGDSFHDGKGADRLGQTDRAHLAELMEGRRWIWITGNHDPAPPLALGGLVQAELVLGPLAFRHIATPSGTGEVSGHFHPKAGLSWRGRRLGGRCFIGDGRRLILPAFGAYAGGLDVRDPAIAGLFAEGARIHILGRHRLHGFAAKQLAELAVEGSPW
jgi:DNA ligase-associated metallophosphoesterase